MLAGATASAACAISMNGSDEILALGFGTLIPDPIATKEATTTALEIGFRQFDCAECYRNEKYVGEAMREVSRQGKVRRAPATSRKISKSRLFPMTRSRKSVKESVHESGSIRVWTRASPGSFPGPAERPSRNFPLSWSMQRSGVTTFPTSPEPDAERYHPGATACD